MPTIHKTPYQLKMDARARRLTLKSRPTSNWGKGFFVAKANSESDIIAQERITRCVEFNRGIIK
jgi:hypothetical protein